MFTFHQQDNAASAAQALADAVAADLQAVLSAKGSVVLAVSGGRSPIAFFEALSQKDLAWENVGITLVDERIVPTDHDDSNTNLVRRYLLNNKAAKAKWIAMISDGIAQEDLTPKAALDFALQHYQRPDVLILGMGGDGHTASLFPQAPQLDEAVDLKNETPLIHTTPVAAPHERISMTLGEILNTPRVYLSIQGEEKKAVFDQAAAKADLQYPVSLILTHEGTNCHVFYTN